MPGTSEQSEHNVGVLAQVLREVQELRAENREMRASLADINTTITGKGKSVGMAEENRISIKDRGEIWEEIEHVRCDQVKRDERRETEDRKRAEELDKELKAIRIELLALQGGAGRFLVRSSEAIGIAIVIAIVLGAFSVIWLTLHQPAPLPPVPEAIAPLLPGPVPPPRPATMFHAHHAP